MSTLHSTQPRAPLAHLRCTPRHRSSSPQPLQTSTPTTVRCLPRPCCSQPRRRSITPAYGCLVACLTSQQQAAPVPVARALRPPSQRAVNPATRPLYALVFTVFKACRQPTLASLAKPTKQRRRSITPAYGCLDARVTSQQQAAPVPFARALWPPSHLALDPATPPLYPLVRVFKACRQPSLASLAIQ